MGSRKKVILLIVEGESDETFLVERLKELFKEHEIKFEPQHGDVLYESNRNNNPVKSIVGNIVKDVLIKRKYKTSDILSVIHIIDTDGCLISEDKVIIDSSQEVNTLYTSTDIRVPNENQKNNILNRNEARTRNIQTMNSITQIVNNKFKYQMYYFSRNLEHVVFDEPNPSSETKVENVETFIEELSIPIEEFLNKYMPNLTQENYNKKYIESWELISQGVNSLQRSTNVPLMFNYIKICTVLLED